MGGNESKQRLASLQKQQQELMKQHAEMAQRLAEEQEKNKKQHEESVEQMGKLMLLLVAAAAAGQQTTKQDEQLIEIEGVVYSVTELIDRGGFGQIYKARAKDSKRIVAIKVMKNSPLIQRDIENEIRFLRITKKLSIDPHPVIDYYGCKVTPDLIFISLELAHCDLLTFWFAGMRDREPTERFAFGLIIIMYTLRALTFLEKLNIIHGDIKPQNLVIVPGENTFYIKLIDFGTVEKMHTLRPQLTVDASKAYTQFFAAPEFLRRDSKNLVSRRLHKKSDAWAAGVMFYLLFFESLPWPDEHEYENFVNDPRAKDIVVPGDGGYKLIIELLLKKNPDERASAKETLLQLKAHPVLGSIVSQLEESFYPVDDVCKMKVPDSVQEEISNLATPQQRAHMARGSSTSGSTSSGPRRSCRYGRDCFRKNPDHKAEFAHPGDSDYSETKSREKVQCRYGKDCYRQKNPEHAAKYAH